MHQPSISQFLTGRGESGDEMLERTLDCTGHRLEMVRRPFEPLLTRSEQPTW